MNYDEYVLLAGEAALSREDWLAVGADRLLAKRKQNSDRVGRYNASKAAQGLVKVCVWVGANKADEIKLIAKGLRT